MVQSYTRRDFLRQGAGAVILGLPLLASGCRRPDTTEKPPEQSAEQVLALARERMARDVKPGVVIVIPEDPAMATRRAGELASLLEGGVNCCELDPNPPVGIADGPVVRPAPVKGLFCQAVFVCLPFAKVQQLCPEATPETAIVLLDRDGRPVETLKARPTLFGADFSVMLTELLYGPEGKRLDAGAQAQRTALGPAESEQFDIAVRDLDSVQSGLREDATLRLQRLMPRSGWMFAAVWQTNPSSEVRLQIERLFEDLYERAPLSEPGSRMPYGVRWELPASVKADPCPACGMVCAPDASRRFLRFAAR